MRPTLLYILLFLIVLSCSKEEDINNHKPVADFTYSENIDKISFSNLSDDMDGDDLKYHWTSSWDVVSFNDKYAENPFMYLVELSSEKQIEIELIVSDGHLSDSVSTNITLPVTTLERLYGLGINYTKGTSNNVGYDWYLDQMNTGPYSNNNCGPASVTMAIKWVNRSFDKTIEDARNTYRTSGGWWYTDDIINYLNLYSMQHKTIVISHIDSLQREINSGNIAILCLDMFWIKDEENALWHIDKFYETDGSGWGHFIVIKGYKIIDQETFYESYDPYSFGVKYKNDTLKGQNRYYRSEDLNTAVVNWWNYAIIVTKSGFKSSQGIDTRFIIHKPGL